jgi:phosphatidylglycerophosphatase A
MSPPRTWDRWVATWFGLGLSPKAPGTVGSLGAIPLYLVLLGRPWQWWAAALCLLTLEGLRAANAVARALNQEDPQLVVVDEVVGALLAMSFVAERRWPAAVLAWVLFRAFDILKPGPIDRVQHLQPPGLGIMADDVLAGLAAGALALGAALVIGF